MGERWTMLEMIREFALDALAYMPGDELERTQQGHAEYFAHLLKPDSDEAWRIKDVEQHNARAALRWLLGHKHAQTVELAQFMRNYLFYTGLHSEARRILPEVLSADIEMAPLIRSDLLSAASINAWAQHDFEEALRYAHAAVDISRAINSQPHTADNLIAFANLYIVMDDCAQAKQVALEALQIGRTIQNLEAIVGALDQLGEAELILGNVVEASAYFEEAYAICWNSDFKQFVYAALACMGMGKIALNRRDYDAALRFLHEALERSEYPAQNLEILDVLAGVIGTMPRRTTADVSRAAKIWGAVEALNEKMGLVNAPGDRRRTDALIAEAHSRINPKTFVAAWAEGRELSLDEAIELAMA
jgi:tetratricopeptide (TPR) repeat protein